MPTALKEMETLTRSFCEGDYTADEYVSRIDDLINRHGAKTEVAKEFPNGLKKYRILDVNGEIIGEYTAR